MKYPILIAALIFLLSGCKTTRQTVKTDTALNESVQLTIWEETTEKTKEENKELLADQHQEREETTEKTTVIKFSDPNEYGEQHILEIAVKEQNKHATIAAIKTIAKEENKQSQTNKIITGNSTSETNLKSATNIIKKEKSQPPCWLNAIIFLIIILIIGLMLKK